jgi:hypothetical protein
MTLRAGRRTGPALLAACLVVGSASLSFVTSGTPGRSPAWDARVGGTCPALIAEYGPPDHYGPWYIGENRREHYETADCLRSMERERPDGRLLAFIRKANGE